MNSQRRNLSTTTLIVFHFVSVVLLACLAASNPARHTEAQLKDYLLNGYEKEGSKICTEVAQNTWNYETDNNPANEEKVTESTLKSAQFTKQAYEDWFRDIDLSTLKDPDIKRMMGDLSLPSESVLTATELKTRTEAIINMTGTYSSAKICPNEQKANCLDSEKLPLDPDIDSLFADPDTDYDTLKYAWKASNDATGKLMREDFQIYVDLSNKIARLNGFKDYGAYWRRSFETDNFVESVDTIWSKIKPFYTKLHRYVSHKLKQHYGDKLDISDGLLPAHILGTTWGEAWTSKDTKVKPYPNESKLDIGQVLLDQKYTPLKIYETSNDFYMSLGLPSNNMSYGPGSMIEKPPGREVTCHATAYDFCDKERFFIKMCTHISMDAFFAVHHEMGHIAYFQLYKNQPITFRADANPAFHEAIGDTISLSVQSITHLKKIKLLPDSYKKTKESSVNMLMTMALDKIVLLPFSLMVEKWRWDIFSGTIGPNEWNKKWWEYRKKYQLLKPPVERSESDFDPGAIYHIATDSQSISYYISHILQFQFFRAFCIEAGQYDPKTKSPPLHECDFYGSKAVGALLTKGLSLGKSKPWPDVLEILTGSREVDVNPILEYFAPLMEFLEENSSQLSEA